MKNTKENRRNTSSLVFSDLPTSKDKLGFKPYVKAVAEFLSHEETLGPITFSVEGPWGSGKTSFMMQLNEELKNRGHFTVVFNAWSHSKSEELWASFSVLLLRRLAKSKTLLNRSYCYLKTLLKRISRGDNSAELLKFTFLLAGLIAMLSLSLFAILSFDVSLVLGVIDILGKKELINILKYFGAGTLGILAWFSCFVLLSKLFINSINNPLFQDISKMIRTSNFYNYRSFNEEFQEDLVSILDVYIKKGGKIFIFIDDLDRCEIPRASNVIEAINLMISNDPRLIFIIGMDREKVAASLGFKYRDILPFLSDKSKSSLVTEDSQNDLDRPRDDALDFGFSFLERFIQVPFSVPQILPATLAKCIREDIIEEPRENNLNENKRGRYFEMLTPPRVWRFGREAKSLAKSLFLGRSAKTSEKVWLLDGEIVSVTDYLEKHSVFLGEFISSLIEIFNLNPRDIKRYMNLIRLHIFIASARGQLSGGLLTVPVICKLVVIELNWPLLFLDIEDDPGLLDVLQMKVFVDYKNYKSRSPLTIQEFRINYWLSKRGLKELLAIGLAKTEDLQFKEIKYLLNNRYFMNFRRTSSRGTGRKGMPVDRVSGIPSIIIDFSVEENIKARAYNVVISSNGHVRGDIECYGIIIEGKVEGSVSIETDVAIKSKGILKGKIKCCKNAIVEGSMEGDIIAAEKIELRAMCYIVGDLTSKSLLLEHGAIFHGTMPLKK